MNTTEIITKLRAQATELTAMADALEEAGASAAFATGAGRYLIHDAVKIGDWTTWESVPAMSLVEDAIGDYCLKTKDAGDWVGIWTGSQRFWYDADPRLDFVAGKNLQRCRVIALDLAGSETGSEFESLVERFKASRVPA